MNTKYHSLAALLIGLFLLARSDAAARAEIKPVGLRCEYRDDPMGIDEEQPRLTWRVEAGGRGEKQWACEILVASRPEWLRPGLADLWDSGKVASDQTVNVAYAGKQLVSRQECFWKVRVWDRESDPTGRESAVARWSMGLLHPEGWKADYISFKDKTPVFKRTDDLFLPPARQYRKEFAAEKEVRRAMIYSTALGVYELRLNGRRVGDALFAPGWSDYHQRAYYNTYDVTSLVRRGPNALGAWVADGWYSGYIGFGLLTGIGVEHIGRYSYGKTPAFMAQLEIEYTDGTRETVVTDTSWKVTGDGPIQQADLLMGELYDARKEMPSWALPGFDDSRWEAAIRAEDNGSAPATFYEYRNLKARPPGKFYDPPMEMPGWYLSGFNGSLWEAAVGADGEGKVSTTFFEHQHPDNGLEVKISGHPVDLRFKRPAKLEAFPGVSVRPMQEIKPVAVTEPKPGTYIFNLGQNFAGVVRLKIPRGGKAGNRITLRYGEMLYPDGRLMTENLRKARAVDTYILSGDPAGESYTPRFTYHGFQYVEVTGFPRRPSRNAVTGIVLHSATPLTSEFRCSDPTANQLFKNIVWTQRANFLDLPTDCPQRDERFGWTGDAQIYVRAATYNADVAAFYTKWLRELMESQRPSGTFPGYAPFPFQHGWDFGTAWCDAGVICPWTIWRAYGDTRIIERCWEPMVKFLDWRKRESRDDLGIIHGNDWGDWLALSEKTPLDYVDTVYFAYSTKLMAEMAGAIGKTDAAADYAQQFERIKDAFNRKYVKPDGSLTVDTQTAYALGLYMDLFPENLRAAAGERLAQKIAANDTRMGTGFLGTRALLPALSEVGQNDLATRLFQSHKFPSWDYEVDQGATTVWERWNSFTKDKGFGDAAMNSFAHYSFGAVCEWMFNRLAGIDTDGPGFARIVIRPSPPSPRSDPDHRPIHWVKAQYNGIHGRIVSNWKLAAGRFDLKTEIPANTTATVYLPARDADVVFEGGHRLGKAPGVTFLRQEGDCVVLAVASGKYHFSTTAPPSLR